MNLENDDGSIPEHAWRMIQDAIGDRRSEDMIANLSGFDAGDYPCAAHGQIDFIPNEFQKAIFEEVAHGTEHLVIQARAGTGKTTTILEALNKVPAGKSVLLCAFNKSIQTELAARAPAMADVKTLHSIGYGCLVRHFGAKPIVDWSHARTVVRKYLKENRVYITGRQTALVKLIGLAKNTLSTEKDQLEALAFQFGLQDWSSPAKVLAEQAMDILDQSADPSDRIVDGDDMIWLPVVHDVKPKSYDVVFVDEAQDLNMCQCWMVAQMIRDGGRLVAVGDPRQAIYRFRGAGSDVISDLVREFSAKVLPLSITYRCPKRIVQMAREVVPDYQPAPDAPDGEVERVEWGDCVKHAEPGCFVLSRKNAPLARMCLELLSRGTPARVAGKDIGRNLIGLIDKSKAASVKDLSAWLDEYRENEAERLLPDKESAYELVCDKVECLGIMMEGESRAADVAAKIEEIFSGDDDDDVVLCSTVHKAKGLERDVVWVMEDTFCRGKSDEEDNIWYVAITRSKGALMLVSADEDDPEW